MGKVEFSQTQQKVLHSMTGLLHGLATAPEAVSDRTDSFLQQINDLPIIQEMLGSEDGGDDATSCDSEVCCLETLRRDTPD